METVTGVSGAHAPHSEAPRWPGGNRPRKLWWWLPVALAGIYAAALIALLPTIVSHSWWSADSASAGVVAQLYTRPPAGQYIVLGDHGWYEAIGFNLLTRGLPAHRLLWYGIPVVAWISAILLVGGSARRAFGPYGAGLAVAGLLCVAPAGLMLVFQPTAHTNVVFHAAALAATATWILPRARTLTLPVLLGAGLLIGAFTGLAIAGDAIALAWAVLPFIVTVAVCAARRPLLVATRMLAFGLAVLAAMVAAAIAFTALMHGAGLRVDELAQSSATRLVSPDALPSNFAKMVNELGYLVGGSFVGHRSDRSAVLALISGGTLLLGSAATALAVCRIAVVGTARMLASRSRPSSSAVSPRLVHVCFWSTCLAVGLLTFLVSSVGALDYRYLVGPLVAIAALLPLAALRSRRWRIAVAAGLAVMALVGLVRLASRPLPYLPEVRPLARADISAVTRFARRYHVRYGYAAYWDAVTVTWHTHFSVHLYPVTRCGRLRERYRPLYHSDSFTAAYIPRRGLRTLFVADGRLGTAPSPAWGRPLATEATGRLVLYAYRYDIAEHFPRPRPGQIQRVIAGGRRP